MPDADKPMTFEEWWSEHRDGLDPTHINYPLVRNLNSKAFKAGRAAGIEEAAVAIEGADWARNRLEHRADGCNAGKIQDGGREWKRAIWAAFSDFDEAREKIRALLPDREGK